MSLFFDTEDRQKENAMSSITEVVQTVKHPRARSEPDGEQEPVEPAPLDTLVAPGTPSSGASLNKSALWDVKEEDSRLSRKMSRRRSSLMG